MDTPPDGDGPLVIRWRPGVVFATYVCAVAFSALTVGLVWLARSGQARSDVVVIVFALLAVPLAGFASVLLWAEAVRRTRGPYLVVDLQAGSITTISAFGHRRGQRLRPGERLAVRFGEAVYGDSFMSGERLVVVRTDGRRSPTHLWGGIAHRGDWDELNARLIRSGGAAGTGR